MNKIILRDYQKNQLAFIEERVDLTDVLGVESPTGSGKTFVMLEYAKRWLQKPENHLSNVIITTGFNNLVFLLEDRALSYGLNAKILIGKKACNCPVCMEESGIEAKLFTLDEKFRNCSKHKDLDVNSKGHEKTCPHTSEFYSGYFQELTTGVGQVIIMNHSSFLVYQEYLANTSLVIADEAHTFGEFYDGFIKLELDKSDLSKIEEAINSVKFPMNKIIEANIQKGVKLPSVQIEALCGKIENLGVKRRAKEFFETEPSFQNYIEAAQDSFTIDRFYRRFEFSIKTKFLLFSATLDKFTRMMFGCRESYFYRERKTFCDYTKSEFIAVPGDDFVDCLKRFINYVDNKGLKAGLCLSTTMVDVNQALKQDGINGYKMFTNIDKFVEFEGKKILVGSRRLFQGIDIQGLEFVSLNKLPFPNWNDKTRKMQDYITDFGRNGIDFWSDYSVPKTENDMIQTTGRLWRTPESFGVVSIFDERIIKHRYMVRHTMHGYRYGIKMNIMHQDSSVEVFDVEKLKDQDKRKDLNLDLSQQIAD